MKKIKKMLRALFVGGLMLPLFVGCAVNPVSGKRELTLMSEAQEISIGRREHPNIVKSYGSYDDAKLQEYVNRIGQRLAAHSHRDNLTYHFTVLDSTEVNAFALPGGYVYITRGLLAYLNSEAELAAVLGHEIGHVTARHGVRQMTAAQMTNIGFTLGSIFVPELQGAQDLLNVLGTAMLRGYGRDHELEADRLGAEYLARTDYDPEAMIDVIRVLKAQERFEQQLAKEENREPQVYHGVFSTHPDNDHRLQEVVRAAEKFKQNGDHGADNRKAFLAMQEGLVFGPGANEGVVRDGAFYHKGLGIALTFPSEWKIDNLPEYVLAIAPGDNAVLQLTAGEHERSLPPAAFIKKHMKTEKIVDGEAIRIDGLEGYTGIVRLRTDLGARDGRVTVIYHNGLAYVFTGFAKSDSDGALKQYDGHFLGVARSFHRLGEDEKAQAEPLRLTIRKAAKGDTFARFARSSRLSDHAEEQLRLLNAKYPEGEPEPGHPIKLVK